MAELVDEHVLRKAGIYGCRCLVVEDATASVLLLVGEDLDELVRRGCRRVAECPIVERQQVALGIEDVVLGGDWRAAERADVRTVDARLRRWQFQPANVEVVLPALERL